MQVIQLSQTKHILKNQPYRIDRTTLFIDNFFKFLKTKYIMEAFEHNVQTLRRCRVVFYIILIKIHPGKIRVQKARTILHPTICSIVLATESMNKSNRVACTRFGHPVQTSEF